jgi:hypothetical protein
MPDEETGGKAIFRALEIGALKILGIAVAIGILIGAVAVLICRGF